MALLILRSDFVASKKYTKEEAQRILCAAAAQYKEKLANRQFLLIYKIQQTYEYEVVSFSPGNFLHLTGIVTEKKPVEFYKLCLKQRLSVRDIGFKTDGNTHRKLAVLGLLPELLYHRCWIGDTLGNDIAIRAEYYVGDTKCVMSLGFRSGRDYDFPITLLNMSIREVTRKEFKIYAIYTKKIGAPAYEPEPAYIEADFDLDKYRNYDFYPLLREE